MDINNFFDDELELSIIGQLLQYPENTSKHLAAILKTDFYRPLNIAIFECLKEEYETNGKYDIVIVGNNLKLKHCELISEFQQQLILAVKAVYTWVHFSEHIFRLKELAATRRVKLKMQEFLSQDSIVQIDQIQKFIDSERENAYSLIYVDKAKQGLTDFEANIGKVSERINLGENHFETINRFIGGLRLKTVTLIGAYPSVGKTAFALNIVTEQTEPVVFFSLEMSTEMIYERYISSTGKIDYGLFTHQDFTPEQLAEIKAETQRIKEKPFYVFDDIYDIESQSNVIANIRPKLVVVDYIQKVRTQKRTDNRRNEIDYISGLYKQIAKQNNCAIILLSQISRAERNEPTMSSLKESGALEADGDVVMILHRPYVLRKDDPTIKPEQAYLLIDKNKFGNTGKTDLVFKGEFQRFYESELDSRNPFI